MLCRIHDAGKMTREELNGAYTQELRRLREIPRSSGGNFYLTQAARVSKRFAAALVASTLEGQTLYRDAFQMLGFSKIATFKELGRTLGVERQWHTSSTATSSFRPKISITAWTSVPPSGIG
jgi:hypothetical protein